MVYMILGVSGPQAGQDHHPSVGGQARSKIDSNMGTNRKKEKDHN